MGYENSQNSPDDSPVVCVGIGVVSRASDSGAPDDAASPGRRHEILITRRPDHTVYGGYWELPGGKLESGESVEDGVRRELREEVGILVEILRPLTPVEHVYDHAHVRLLPLLCRMAENSPEPRNLEVAEHRWCPLDRLNEYQFPEANEQLIAEVGRTLQ